MAIDVIFRAYDEEALKTLDIVFEQEGAINFIITDGNNDLMECLIHPISAKALAERILNELK